MITLSCPPESSVCQWNLTTIFHAAGSLGIPIATNNTESTMTSLVSLSIRVDIVKGLLLTPPKGETEMTQTITHSVGWLESLLLYRTGVTDCQLEQCLQDVREGQSFLYWMIDLLHSWLEHHSLTLIRLNRDLQADLALWKRFIKEWNGISFLDGPELLPTQHTTPDASWQWRLWCMVSATVVSVAMDERNETGR